MKTYKDVKLGCDKCEPVNYCHTCHSISSAWYLLTYVRHAIKAGNAEDARYFARQVASNGNEYLKG